MEVEHEGKIYKTQYIPFFRIKKLDGYQIFGLRYPSGRVERVFIIDGRKPVPEMIEYLRYLIKEYMREDYVPLTPYARMLKEDIDDLFR